MANHNFKVKKGLEVGTGVTISDGNINISGIITAQFKGDGSQLTGVTASGSGVVVQEEGSSVGTAATINFIGSNVTAALSGGIANVTVSGGGGDVVSDTTPQLGGNLDLNSKNISGTGNIDITGYAAVSGVATFSQNVTFESAASFGDNDKINVGTGNDLQIFHDGTSNIISDAVGAGISLVGNTKVVGVLTATGVSKFSGDVDIDAGLDITGTTRIGPSNQISISHNTSNGTITCDTGYQYIRGASGFRVQKEGGGYDDIIIANSDGGVELFYDDTKKFETTSTGISISGNINTVTDISCNSIANNAGGGATWSLFNTGNATFSATVTANTLNIPNGANAPFTLYGSSKEAYIRNTGTDANGININANASVTLGGGGTSGFSVQADSDGTAKLFGPGPSEKLRTTSTGVVITGVATATSFSGSGSALTGLTGASAGTFGASTSTPVITVDSNGRITGIATVATSGAGGGGGISNIVEDTTPQLGGNLDLNSKDITGTGNISITGVSTFNGAVGFTTHIHDAGTGGLDIRTNLLRIKNDADSETLATFAEDGAVSFYHDNTLKFATSATGASVTGTLAADGITLGDSEALDIGANQDLQLIHDGSNSYINSTVGGTLFIRGANGNHIKLQSPAGEDSVVADANGGVKLYYDNAKKLETVNAGVTVTGTLAATAVTGDGSGLTNLPASGISTADTNVQVTYSITASGNNYRFTGPGNDAGDNQPDLYLVRGQRYRFTNNSGGSHPFQIRSAVGGSAYSTGVTNNGAASGNIDFNVQHDAPSRLYYQCTSHSAMVGNIYITGGGQWENTSVAASGTPKIYTDYSVGIGTDNPNSLGKVSIVMPTAGGSGAINVLSPTVGAGQTNIVIRSIDNNGGNWADAEFRAEGYSFKTRTTERLSIGIDGIVRVPDNGKFTAGAGDDLQIYHTGSHSFIDDTGTGGLYIRGGGQIGFRDSENSFANFANFNSGGSIDLYYNGSKRFETVSNGIKVTNRIFLGNSTNGGFDYNSTADTLEVLTTNGSTHSEWTNNAYVPNTNAGKTLGYHNKRWDTLYVDKVAFGGATNTSQHSLDDYEEGTFDPTITPSSGSITLHGGYNTLSYTKIGRIVHISGQIRITSVSSPSGNTTITNLPFTAQSTTEQGRAGAAMFYYDASAGTGNYYKAIPIHVTEGTTTLNILNLHTVGGLNPAGNDELAFAFSYIAS